MVKMRAAIAMLLGGCASLLGIEDPRTGSGSGSDAPTSDAAFDAPLAGPSCTGLAAACGASHSDNCCSTATTIAGGTFYRSYDATGAGTMNYPATVSAFALDRYEVTVSRFRKFVDAGKGTRSSAPNAGAGAHPRIAGSGWNAAWTTNLSADSAALRAALACHAPYQTWTDSPGANEQRPITCVSWYEAFAFCAWDGGFLPTEAEWNYAAAGGSEQRAYPWSEPASSTTIDCQHANYDGAPPCADALVDVGSRGGAGDGRWGHSDLAGNVWEWILDYYASPYPQATCNDCANLSAATERVLRGGGFLSPPPSLRTGARDKRELLRDWYVGIRCARSP
jgi:formylglycine-generating enzyme required for sulfatase activity